MDIAARLSDPAFMAMMEEMTEAKETDDPQAAIEHAGRVKRKPTVVALLAAIGAPDALAGYGTPVDYRKFRGLASVTAPLVRANMDSDENLALLFGNPRHVKGLVLELRSMMGAAAAGSPADLHGFGPSRPPAIRSTRRKLRCSHCDAEEDGVTVILKHCSACRRASFCDTACQKKAWSQHKTMCRSIQAMRKGLVETWEPLLSAPKDPFPLYWSELESSFAIDLEDAVFVLGVIDECTPKRLYERADISDAAKTFVEDLLDPDRELSFTHEFECRGCNHVEDGLPLRSFSMTLTAVRSTTTGEVQLIGDATFGPGCVACGDAKGEGGVVRKLTFKGSPSAPDYVVQQEEYEEQASAMIASFRDELYSYNCMAEGPLLAHFLSDYHLRHLATLAGFEDSFMSPLIPFPKGDENFAIPLMRGRCMPLRQFRTGTELMVRYERLFDDFGEGTLSGVHVYCMDVRFKDGPWRRIPCAHRSRGEVEHRISSAGSGQRSAF